MLRLPGPYRPQHAVQVRVREAPLRIETRAHFLERLPLGIAGSERLRRLEVQFAPVRAATVVVHDVLYRLEVLLVLHPFEDVHRDVARIAAAGRAERNVVAGGEPDFDREDRD